MTQPYDCDKEVTIANQVMVPFCNMTDKQTAGL